MSFINNQVQYRKLFANITVIVFIARYLQKLTVEDIYYVPQFLTKIGFITKGFWLKQTILNKVSDGGFILNSCNLYVSFTGGAFLVSIDT